MFALLAALGLFFTAVVALGLPAAAAAPKGCASSTVGGSSRSGHFSGIAKPQRVTPGCVRPSGSEGPYNTNTTPPLIDHHGPVMATPAVNSTLVVTPIYWAPAGYGFPSTYTTVINKYLADVGTDSGTTTNVFASNTQYPGSNGTGSYHIVAATPVLDSNQYPSAGCVTSGGSIYGDGTGYSTCLDDAQIVAETDSVISTNG